MLTNFDPRKHKKYFPVNKKKYIGKSIPITRSSWEFAFCRYLDHNTNVIEWSSESLVIKYMFMGKSKRYYPDFIAKIKSGDKIITWVIEVKPYKETIAPKITKGKARKTRLYEAHTFEKNKQKWIYAKKFCKKMGWKFVIITEKELF